MVIRRIAHECKIRMLESSSLTYVLTQRKGSSGLGGTMRSEQVCSERTEKCSVKCMCSERNEG